MNKQDENLIKNFLFEMEDTSESSFELFWVLPPLLFSKKIFKKKQDVQEFVETILGISLSSYVYRSRTLLVGQVNKKIFQMDIETSVEIRNNVIKFLKGIIINESQSKKSGVDNNFFSDWAKYLINNKKNNEY